MRKALIMMAALLAPVVAQAAPVHHHEVVMTVLYNAPHDPAAFESYYAKTHLPLVARIKGLERVVLIKGTPGGDGAPPAFYRIAQLFFASPAQMARSMGSPAAQTAVADIKNFADGGVTVVTGEIP